jgi:transposase-like protein
MKTGDRVSAAWNRLGRSRCLTTGVLKDCPVPVDGARISRVDESHGGSTWVGIPGSGGSQRLGWPSIIVGISSTRIGALRRVGEQLDVSPETLRIWVSRVEIDAGERPGTTTEEAKRIADLKSEVTELRRANETLRTASALLPCRSSTAYSK